MEVYSTRSQQSTVGWLASKDSETEGAYATDLTLGSCGQHLQLAKRFDGWSFTRL
jgi:hypothetical protein